jgi:hypothetical protein
MSCRATDDDDDDDDDNNNNRMFLGSKVRLVRRADNLAAICEPIV